MKVIKVLGLAILGFLLFMSLSLFGLAFTLNSTILNPEFVSRQVNRLDVSALAEEFMSVQSNSGEFPPEVRTALLNSIDKAEPRLKQEVNEAAHLIYDYILGKSADIDLTQVLRQTVLSKDAIVLFIEDIDLSPLIADYLRDQLPNDIPPELTRYVDESLEKTITDLKPWIKQQVTANVDPVLDYVFYGGQSPAVVIQMEPVYQTFRANAKDAFLKSPPTVLAALPEAEQEKYFNQYYDQYAGELSPTFSVSNALFGGDARTGLSTSLAEAKEALLQAREIIGWFKLGFILLVVFMLLLIAGIALIYRSVRGTTRDLGITFATYGALEFVVVFLARYFLGKWLPPVGMPMPIETWLAQFFSDLLTPLMILSISFFIAGVALILVSVFYKPRNKTMPRPGQPVHSAAP